MVKTITHNKDSFLKRNGIESLRLYGNPGEFYFSFSTFLDEKGRGANYIWRKPLVAKNMQGALKEFKAACERWLHKKSC